MNDDEQPMGEILAGERPALRFVRRFRHRPEKVWRALTQSEHLRHWMPCDLVGAREAGAVLEVPFWPDVVAKYEIAEPVVRGEIRAWEPPRLFEWVWDTDVLRWELEPDGDTTVVTLTVWIDPAGAPAWSAAAGYHVCLDHLRLVLDTGIAPSIAAADPSAWEERYRAVADEALR